MPRKRLPNPQETIKIRRLPTKGEPVTIPGVPDSFLPHEKIN